MRFTLYPSGTFIDILYLKKEDIFIEDIASTLAKEPRFMGHMCENYSVADHCYYASSLVPKELALAALLHDSQEYLLKDMATHMKAKMYFKIHDNYITYKEVELSIQYTIFKSFGIEGQLPLDTRIKDVDDQLKIKEGHQFTKGKWDLPCNILEKLEPLDWKGSRDRFLNRFYAITKESPVNNNS
jgi:hypothetical protein